MARGKSAKSASGRSGKSAAEVGTDVSSNSEANGQYGTVADDSEGLFESSPTNSGKLVDRKEIKSLVAKAKQRGFVTMDEVNEALPDEAMASDQLDEVLELFAKSEIEVVDKGKPQRVSCRRQGEIIEGQSERRRGQRQVERSGTYVPAQDGLGAAPHPRR